jgi:hypothetical protein
LRIARRQHVAVALPDGRALVAGGDGAISPTTHGLVDSVEIYGFDVPGTGKLLSSAEIDDAPRGTWLGAGAMAEARFDFRATLLEDGRVLVTGGSAIAADHVLPGADTVSSSSEIYTP